MVWYGSKKMEWTAQKLNEVESRKGNGQEGNEAEWSGVEWSGVEWSGVEW